MRKILTRDASRIVRSVTLRPSDHGKEMSLDDFEHAAGREGYRYELIDGRIEVSPAAEMPHDDIADWLHNEFCEYRNKHRDIIKKVSGRARIHILGRRLSTCPEPDVAVYDRYPHFVPLRNRSWRLAFPMLVCEVISADTWRKDLERNVVLYLEVPSIREYWVLDTRPDPAQPKLIVYRRRGKRWQKPIEVPFGGTYETKLLPGFKFVVDPSQAI